MLFHQASCSSVSGAENSPPAVSWRQFFAVRQVVAIPADQRRVAGVFKQKLQRRRFDVAVANPNGIAASSPRLTKTQGVIVGAVAHEENLYDGDALRPALAQTRAITERQPAKAIVDRGYRGRKEGDGNQPGGCVSGSGRAADFHRHFAV